MSDSCVLAELKVSRGQRSYFWSLRFRRLLPIPRKEIISNSANLHLIPAREDVRDKLLAVRKGEIVTLGGFLAQAQQPDGSIGRTR